MFVLTTMDNKNKSVLPVWKNCFENMTDLLFSRNSQSMPPTRNCSILYPDSLNLSWRHRCHERMVIKLVVVHCRTHRVLGRRLKAQRHLCRESTVRAPLQHMRLLSACSCYQVYAFVCSNGSLGCLFSKQWHQVPSSKCSWENKHQGKAH